MIYILKNIYKVIVTVLEVVSRTDRRISDLEKDIDDIKSILSPNPAVSVNLSGSSGPVQEQS